jgi:hypothetical protein
MPTDQKTTAPEMLPALRHFLETTDLPNLSSVHIGRVRSGRCAAVIVFGGQWGETSPTFWVLAPRENEETLQRAVLFLLTGIERAFGDMEENYPAVHDYAPEAFDDFVTAGLAHAKRVYRQLPETHDVA